MYIAERHFVTTAKAQLRLLVRMDDAVNMMTHGEIKTAIHSIKLAARPVKARAVYRAALLCEDVLNRNPITSTNFQTSLRSLKTLVNLYADGLLEIDPDFKSVLLDGTITQNIATPERAHEIQDAQIAANENAVKTLTPLLKFVRSKGTSDALEILTKYNQNLSSNEDTPKLLRPSVQFEAMMRQVTNQTLSTARAQSKDVSISYASDFETIAQTTAAPLKFLLENTCLEIVKNSLPETTNTQKRTWQISLTGHKKNKNLEISLTWPGMPLSAQAVQTLKALPLQVSYGQIYMKTHVQADRDNVLGRDSGIDIQTLIITCPTTPKASAQRLPTPHHAVQVGEA